MPLFTGFIDSMKNIFMNCCFAQAMFVIPIDFGIKPEEET